MHRSSDVFQSAAQIPGFPNIVVDYEFDAERGVSICRADSWLPQLLRRRLHADYYAEFQSAAQIPGFPNPRQRARSRGQDMSFNLPRRFLASPTSWL